MEFSVEQFNKVKRDAEEFYQNIGKVSSSYFKNEKIHFNTKGWDHLIFKTWNSARPIKDQYNRLRHIKLAPEVIKQSRTLQGILTKEKFERIKKKDGEWQSVMKVTTYYEFIAIMESHNSKVRVKVIVKQVHGGEKFFLSIIPFWGLSKQGERIMHSGSPEYD